MSAAKIEQYATLGLMVGMGLLAMRMVNGGAASVAAGAVGVADDVAGGLVQGVGAAFGVPMTNKTECQRAKDEGRILDASFLCPAGEWIGYTTGAASTAAGGLIQGAGQAVGVPRTDLTECERAKAEGRTLDASFKCPAGDFLRYLMG
jgi:hypothetical protein